MKKCLRCHCSANSSWLITREVICVTRLTHLVKKSTHYIITLELFAVEWERKHFCTRISQYVQVQNNSYFLSFGLCDYNIIVPLQQNHWGFPTTFHSDVTLRKNYFKRFTVLHPFQQCVRFWCNHSGWWVMVNKVSWVIISDTTILYSSTENLSKRFYAKNWPFKTTRLLPSYFTVRFKASEISRCQHVEQSWFTGSTWTHDGQQSSWLCVSSD